MKFNISSHLKIAYKIKTQLELNRFLVGFLFYIIQIRGTKSKNKTQLSKLGQLNYPVSLIVKKSV